MNIKMTSEKLKLSFFLVTGLACSLLTGKALAQSNNTDASDLAKKLTNPVASLISVPFQYNYDANIGIDKKGTSNSLVVQPVIPLKLNRDWNYILRPVMTFESLNNVNGYSGTGAGPIVIESFFSPKSSGGLIWGVGPVVSTPSLSGANFGTSQTGVGVSAVGLLMKSPWTLGVLTYNTWSAGGSAENGTANNLFYQPFVSYVTPSAWTYSLNTQSTFNWDVRRAQNPMNFTVSKLVKFGETPVSFSVGARYYLSSVPGGASGWGARASMTFIFPE
ncbi:transporter [Zwartia sp.]|uniref:transporter n=1 Tax=Zwartia sp. TaxID=2978004 RepID=UPI0027199AA3|nr:transporter [Zwartia sp.]MDO9023763.1 transporter [Zwartia sp.]